MSNLFRKYHDEDYDGIVIKIPAILFTVNKAEDIIEEWKNQLEERIQKSKFHPDFERSLYELENWKDKVEEVRIRNQREKERYENECERRAVYLKKRESGDIIELEWKEVIDNTDDDSIVIAGQQWEWKDMFNKRSWKSKVLKEINIQLNELDEEGIKEFFRSNGFLFLLHRIKLSRYNEYWRLGEKGSSPLYLDSGGCLAFRIDVLYVREFCKSDRYRLIQLEIKDGRLGYGYGTSKPVCLGNYDKVGMTLVKNLKI